MPGCFSGATRKRTSRNNAGPPSTAELNRHTTPGGSARTSPDNSQRRSPPAQRTAPSSASSSVFCARTPTSCRHAPCDEYRDPRATSAGRRTPSPHRFSFLGSERDHRSVRQLLRSVWYGAEPAAAVLAGLGAGGGVHRACAARRGGTAGSSPDRDSRTPGAGRQPQTQGPGRRADTELRCRDLQTPQCHRMCLRQGHCRNKKRAG